MTNKEVAALIATCLQQKLNDDPMVKDGDREWWYVSPLYKKDQEVRVMSPSELVEAIQELDLDSILEVKSYVLGSIESAVRDLIQIRGNRLDIINECNQVM